MCIQLCFITNCSSQLSVLSLCVNAVFLAYARWLYWSIFMRTSMSMQTLKLPTSCWVTETLNRLVHYRYPLIILHVHRSETCSILQNIHFMYITQLIAMLLCAHYINNANGQLTAIHFNEYYVCVCVHPVVRCRST